MRKHKAVTFQPNQKRRRLSNRGIKPLCVSDSENGNRYGIKPKLGLCNVCLCVMSISRLVYDGTSALRHLPQGVRQNA